MAVVMTTKRTNYVGKYRQVYIRMDYGNGDTALTVDTGLKIVYGYTVSPTSVTAKGSDHTTLAGGVLTINVTDPLAACYLSVTATGL